MVKILIVPEQRTTKAPQPHWGWCFCPMHAGGSGQVGAGQQAGLMHQWVQDQSLLQGLLLPWQNRIAAYSLSSMVLCRLLSTVKQFPHAFHTTQGVLVFLGHCWAPS